MAVLSMKQFLEAGAHFGHQTKRWPPAMAPYIYGAKGGIHIIDLRQTLRKLKDAYDFVKKSSAQGQTVLFVGTKPQISRVVREEAERCNSSFVNYRWLGGLLTNFSTVRESINRLQQYEDMAGEDFSYEGIIIKIQWCARVRLFLLNGTVHTHDRAFLLGNTPIAQIVDP